MQTLTLQPDKAYLELNPLIINNFRISISKISKSNLRVTWYKCRSRNESPSQIVFHLNRVRTQYSLNSAKSANLNKRITCFLSLISSSIKSKKAPIRAQNMALQIYSINSGMNSISWKNIPLPKIKTMQKMISISSISIQISNLNLPSSLKRPILNPILQHQHNESNLLESNLTLKDL